MNFSLLYEVKRIVTFSGRKIGMNIESYFVF